MKEPWGAEETERLRRSPKTWSYWMSDLTMESPGIEIFYEGAVASCKRLQKKKCSAKQVWICRDAGTNADGGDGGFPGKTENPESFKPAIRK